MKQITDIQKDATRVACFYNPSIHQIKKTRSEKQIGLKLDDWLLQAEKYQKTVRPQVLFCTFKGSTLDYPHISADNPVFELFETESLGQDPIAVEKALQLVNEIIGRVKKSFKEAREAGTPLSPQEQLTRASQIIHTEMNIVTDPLDVKALYQGLSASAPRIDCDTGSLLFIAIGHECNWPLSVVFCSSSKTKDGNHALLKWNEFPKTSFYFETTNGCFLDDLAENSEYQDWTKQEEGTADQLLGHAYLYAGQQQFYQKNYTEAVRLFTIAFEKNAFGPPRETLYETRAICYLDEQKLNEALQDVQKALSLAPENQEDQLLYQEILYQVAFTNKHYLEALAITQTLLRIEPNNQKYSEFRNKALYLQALAYSAGAKYTEALTSFETLIGLEPNNEEYLSFRKDALYLRAMTYYTTQKYSEALADIRQLLTLAPENKDYQMFHQEILYYLACTNSQYAEALVIANTLLGMKPNNEKYIEFHKDALYNRAVGYYNTQKYSEALADIQQLLNLAPENKDYQVLYQSILYNTAADYYNNHQFIEALSNINQLLVVYPDNEKGRKLRNDILYYGAITSAKNGLYTEALRNLELLIKLQPDNTDYITMYNLVKKASENP